MQRSTLVVLAFVSACASEHERGEVTDAFVEAPRAADSAAAHETSTAVDAAASVDAEPVSQVDAGDVVRDASLASGTPGADSCILKLITCATETVDVRGTSPWGELHIWQVGVSYWSGFTSGTNVFARGDVAGAAIELNVSPVPRDFWEPAAPPGEYPSESTLGLRARYYDCAGSTELKAALRIDRNDGPPPGLLSDWPGKPVRFEAVLTVSEPGWSLRLPLSISKVCDSWTDV